MLNYKNDSLLSNKETVNDLIRDKKENLIFLDKDRKILNLFSAFIKKEDFIKKGKKNQILQKTVYVKLTNNLTEILKGKFSDKRDLMKLLEGYIGKRSISKNTINKWFDSTIFPLILLRAISKDKEELSKFIKEITYFTDFLNKSRFDCPKTLNDLFDKKIIYLVGCSFGDGHINKDGKRWTLVDGSSKEVDYSKKFIMNLTILLKNYLSKWEIREFETKYALRVNNKLFCRFLNFFFGLPFGKKKEVVLEKPKIFNFNNQYFEKYFWRGYYDTDGSVNNQGAVDFCSNDQNIISQCIKYLTDISIGSKKTKRGLTIGMPYLNKFSCIGFAHSRKQKELLKILKRGSKYIDIKIRKDRNIDKRLKKIYKSLRIDNNYRVRIHSRNLKESGVNENEVRRIVKELFNYDFKKGSKNLLYFKSKRVFDYLNELFIFEPYWKPINSKEENQLLKEWNNIWS